MKSKYSILPFILAALFVLSTPIFANATPIKTKNLTFHIKGMTCGGCVSNVTRMLKGLKGVIAVKVTLTPQRAFVTFNPAALKQKQIIKSITQAGYDVTKTVSPKKAVAKKVIAKKAGCKCSGCAKKGKCKAGCKCSGKKGKKAKCKAKGKKCNAKKKGECKAKGKKCNAKKKGECKCPGCPGSKSKDAKCEAGCKCPKGAAQKGKKDKK